MLDVWDREEARSSTKHSTMPSNEWRDGIYKKEAHENDIKDQGKGNTMLEKSKGMRICYGWLYYEPNEVTATLHGLSTGNITLLLRRRFGSIRHTWLTKFHCKYISNQKQVPGKAMEKEHMEAAITDRTEGFLSVKSIDTFCFMILKLLYSGTFFLNWPSGLGVNEVHGECCPPIPTLISGNSETVTASCPGLCRSVTVTRGTEWRELELDWVGLTFPLFTPLVKGLCNKSVNQTRIIKIKDDRNFSTCNVGSLYMTNAWDSLVA